MVLVRSVGIVFAIGLIVLFVVGNEVPQSEAVVTGYEIDAVKRRASVVLIEIRTAGHTGRHERNHVGVALHETPHVVPKLAVPFRPAAPIRKSSDLVKSGGVPGFSNELRIGKDRIASNGFEKRRIG